MLSWELDSSLGPGVYLRIAAVNSRRADSHFEPARISIGRTATSDPDTTPPAIVAKLPVVVEAKLAVGEFVVVFYSAPPATDNVDGPVGVVCQPSSGSKLALGTWTVACSSRDKAGNVGTSNFAIVVRLPTTPGAVTNPGNLDKPLHDVEPGQRVRVTAGGFGPGSVVELRFVTATGVVVDLGTTTAASNGRIDVRPRVPENAQTGPSQMTALGVDAGGNDFVRGWNLTVTAG